MSLMKFNIWIYYMLFYFIVALGKFPQCFKALMVPIETVLHFENGIKKETKIPVETNFTSFNLIYH